MSSICLLRATSIREVFIEENECINEINKLITSGWTYHGFTKVKGKQKYVNCPYFKINAYRDSNNLHTALLFHRLYENNIYRNFYLAHLLTL